MTIPQHPSDPPPYGAPAQQPQQQPHPNYGQPQYPAQPQYQPQAAPAAPFSYAQPQQPAGSQHQQGVAPSSAPRPSMWAAFGPGRNTFGVISITAAAASLVIGIIFLFVNAFTIIGGNYQLVGLLGGVNSFFSIVLMLVATGFGIAGLLSRNPSKWPSVAGTALGIVGLISTVFGFITSALYSIF